MNFEKAVRNINRSLNKKQSTSFNPQWIKNRCKISYQFIIESVKTELGEPDWDLVISRLERCNQVLWMKGAKKESVEQYEDVKELNIVLEKYSNKLYTFLWQSSKGDKIVCDWISIRLVRIAQKGNVLAKEKIVSLSRGLMDQWIENDSSLANWKGYDELVHKHIEGCIERFRYTGSFLGYLYRTLEYSGRGLTPLEKYSFDEFLLDSSRRRIDVFVGRE